jgi:hypothetical protein
VWQPISNAPRHEQMGIFTETGLITAWRIK